MLRFICILLLFIGGFLASNFLITLPEVFLLQGANKILMKDFLLEKKNLKWIKVVYPASVIGCMFAAFFLFGTRILPNYKGDIVLFLFSAYMGTQMRAPKGLFEIFLKIGIEREGRSGPDYCICHKNNLWVGVIRICICILLHITVAYVLPTYCEKYNELTMLC